MEDRKEQLFDMLFDVLAELTEHESPEIIFDRIVDNFAATVEYHTGQAESFKVMLDTFRHDNPADTIPSKPDWEQIYGGMDEIQREFMSADADRFMKHIKNLHFPDSN